MLGAADDDDDVVVVVVVVDVLLPLPASPFTLRRSLFFLLARFGPFLLWRLHASHPSGNKLASPSFLSLSSSSPLLLLLLL